MLKFKQAVSIFFILLFNLAQPTYTYSLFPIGIGGSNNKMEYLVMDVSSDQKIAVAGQCLDNNMCGANDNIFVQLIDDVAK